jgi:uncharacterized membrane protein YesL
VKSQPLQMTVEIVKKSALDVWEEALYLIIFNVIWFLGALLILPFPLLTFALFFTVYDISQGKGIKFGSFFEYGRQMWKQAYTWGVINLGVFVLAWVNISFYNQIEAQWAAVIQMVIIAMTIFWAILQLVSLPMYPRLKEPGFRLALRNAAAVVGLQPLAIFTLIVIVGLMGVITLFFQAIAFLATVSIIAVAANRTVETVLQRVMDKKEETEIQEE